MCLWCVMVNKGLLPSTVKQQETDEEMARQLQQEYDINASYTAHDATLAQQLQEEDGLVSSHQDMLSEQYARQLQEEEDQNAMKVSGGQFDERQRRLAEQQRQRQTDYSLQSEKRLADLRKQIPEHRRREEEDFKSKNEARHNDEQGHHQPSYQLENYATAHQRLSPSPSLPSPSPPTCSFTEDTFSPERLLQDPQCECSSFTVKTLNLFTGNFVQCCYCQQYFSAFAVRGHEVCCS